MADHAWTFIKMHGLGNDYLFLDALAGGAAALAPPEVVRAASDRHRGIGSDGVIALLPPETPGTAFRMRIWNADGSEGEMCGNGLRCAVKLYYESGYASRATPAVVVGTGAGPLTVEPRWQGDRVVACREEMGRPAVLSPGGAAAPLVDGEVRWTGVAGERRHRATAVSMGNPHLVLFLDGAPDDPAVTVDGPVLERHPLFPGRVNVGFAQVLSPDRVRLAVWERGSGATQACGTGAAACLAAGILTGRLARRAVVELPGGPLEADWASDDASLYLTGPAVRVGPVTFDPS